LPQYNVLIAAEYIDLNPDVKQEMFLRIEEHGFEKIPTVSAAWELACEANDETDAKDRALDAFVNVCRTYPFELRLVVQCGTSQVLRRKKKFEP